MAEDREVLRTDFERFEKAVKKVLTAPNPESTERPLSASGLKRPLRKSARLPTSGLRELRLPILARQFSVVRRFPAALLTHAHRPL